MLCDVCLGVLQHRRNLLHDEPTNDKATDRNIKCGHHSTFPSFLKSATDNCSVCESIWARLSVTEQTSLRSEHDYEGTSTQNFITCAIICRGHIQEQYKFHVFFITSPWQYGPGLFTLEKLASNTSELPVHPRKGYSVHQTSSDKSMQTAMVWLQSCLRTHGACNKDTSTTSWYPTRLLDVTASGLQKNYVRLIVTAEEHPTGPYMTLSHCWGQASFIQLTRATEPAFRHAIAIADMPRTFREAIQVTRRLGVRYLWIDSLSIFQDDISDWSHEAGLMHAVYSYSYCNLAAADAEDSSRGLFRSCDPRMLDRVRVNVYLGDIDRSVVHAECSVTDHYFWDRYVHNCHLNTRGWVFQERLLAPRVLYFGRNQLMWECREEDACETYPQGLPSVLQTSLTNFKALDPHIYIAKGLSTDHASAMLELWYDLIVRMYQATSLTKPTDKLIALSGIAKQMRPIIKDTYIAGMWCKDLESALSWWICTSDNVSFRPKEYCAPSWSWASITNGPTAFLGPQKEGLMVKVEDIRLTYATEDTTGAVTGGWLALRGFLKPMELTLRETDSPTSKMWHMVLDNIVLASQCVVVALDVPFDDNAFDNDNAENRLFFMPCRAPTDLNRGTTAVLLLRLADVENKIFERIGLAQGFSQATRENLLAKLDEETKASLPCLRYENGMHTIRIV